MVVEWWVLVVGLMKTYGSSLIFKPSLNGLQVLAISTSVFNLECLIEKLGLNTDSLKTGRLFCVLTTWTFE